MSLRPISNSLSAKGDRPHFAQQHVGGEVPKLWEHMSNKDLCEYGTEVVGYHVLCWRPTLKAIRKLNSKQ